MKKYIFIVLWALLYSLSPLLSVRFAKAELSYAPYAYIPTNNVYFYSDDPDPYKRQGLFRLPYSYYVRVIAEETDYYRVEYLTDGSRTKKINGYCRKSEIVPVDYIPEMPYLYLTIDVTYTLSGGGKDETFSSITVTCAYYGDYTDGTKQYAYVLREDVCGYVIKPHDLKYDKNTEYDDRHKTEPPTTEKQKEKNDSLNAGQITLLVLLCLLIPVIAALIVRQPPTKSPYDEDE